MNVKTCTKCDIDKPLSYFHSSKNTKDGFRYWCKGCCKEYGKQWVLRNANNPRKIHKHLIAINRSKDRKTVHISEEGFVKWYDSQPKKCGYCDIPENLLMILPEHYKMNRTRLAIDCKTNDLEYREGNIVLSCGRCNSVKGDIFDYKTFREIAQKYLKPLWKNIPILHV